MTQIDQHDSKPAPAVLPEDFGARLRDARLDLGISLESAGRRLRIPVRVLQQLESGDLSGIDTPLYLRGYLRSYTRLLGVELPEVEVAHDDFAIKPLPLESSAGISHGRYLLQRYATAATYVAITALIVVPTVWFGLHGGLQRDLAQLVPLEGQALVGADDGTAGDSAGNAAGPRGNGPFKASMSPSFLFLEPRQNNDRQSAMTSQVDRASADAPAATPPVVEETTDVAPAPQDFGETVNLRLVLSEPSWVEVTDDSGRKVEYALLEPGEHRYSGQRALDVLIGNAGAAAVTADGRSVDLSAYRSGDLARFRVDAGAAPGSRR